MSNSQKPQSKIQKKQFFCPLGCGIMWWRGLEYSECPLVPSHRDMPECKECKLRIDKKWEFNKETWKDKPVKKKKKRFNKNKDRKKKQGERR